MRVTMENDLVPRYKTLGGQQEGDETRNSTSHGNQEHGPETGKNINKMNPTQPNQHKMLRHNRN